MKQISRFCGYFSVLCKLWHATESENCVILKTLFSQQSLNRFKYRYRLQTFAIDRNKAKQKTKKHKHTQLVDTLISSMRAVRIYEQACCTRFTHMANTNVEDTQFAIEMRYIRIHICQSSLFKRTPNEQAEKSECKCETKKK